MTDIENALQLRSVIGKVAAVFCILLSLAVLDAVVAGFRQSKTIFDALPGTSIDLNGLAPEKVGSTKDIVYTGSSDLIRLSIDSIQKGYWLGNKMWQGRIIISPDIKAGEYSLAVGVEGIKTQKPSDKFLIRVYKDYESYRHSFKSLIKRYLDISPWFFVALFFPLIILAFGYIFLLSGKIDKIMTIQGKSVIYKVKRVKESCEIFFGLGANHGIKASACLTVFSEEGIPVGTAVVQNVFETDSLASIESACAVKPGYMVAIHKR